MKDNNGKRSKKSKSVEVLEIHILEVLTEESFRRVMSERPRGNIRVSTPGYSGSTGLQPRKLENRDW